MKNSIIPMSVMLVAGLALPLQAAVLVEYDGANDYSSADSNFSRTDVESGTGPYYSTNAFSDSNPLSPSSDYTGPRFYGGYQYASSTVEGYLSRQQIRQYASGDQIYIQAYRGGGWAGSTLSIHGIYLFNQADFNSGFETGSVSVSGFSMTWSGYISTPDAGADFDGRLAVQKDGLYYLSQYVIDLANNNGSMAISGSALENVQWAVYDPSSDLNFDSSSAVFGNLSLDSITAVGIYFEDDGWNGSGDQTTSFGLGVKSFTVEGSAIPESSSTSIIFGLAILLLTSRYSRKRD